MFVRINNVINNIFILVFITFKEKQKKYIYIKRGNIDFGGNIQVINIRRKGKGKASVFV